MATLEIPDELLDLLQKLANEEGRKPVDLLTREINRIDTLRHQKVFAWGHTVMLPCLMRECYLRKGTAQKPAT